MDKLQFLQAHFHPWKMGKPTVHPARLYENDMRLSTQGTSTVPDTRGARAAAAIITGSTSAGEDGHRFLSTLTGLRSTLLA